MRYGWTACARLVLLSALALGCGDDKAGSGPSGGGKPGREGGGAKKGPQAFPVEVAEVQARDVTLVVPAVGSVDAFERVQVTARVSGVVERVKFTEGDVVKRDQVLVEIEPQRYQVAIRSAKAALERVKASQGEAAAALARREQAIAKSPGLIPAEELETWRTKQSLAAAEEMEAKARYDEAALNLRDAYVRAPAAGIIETRNVQTGQYMQPGVVLATLVQRDPLLLRFQAAEADAGKLKKGMTVAFTVQGDPTPFRATITHVAALADTTTRMVPVTGEVDKEQRDKLRPGSFAEVTVSVGTTSNAPIVPEISVRPSERGFLAYVIEGDGEKKVARERIVTLGMHTSDGHVEVRDGLKVGEKLVIRGGEALKEGAAVRVQAPQGKTVLDRDKGTEVAAP
jgi:multidrug efflux system membrane fusion protein